MRWWHKAAGYAIAACLLLTACSSQQPPAQNSSVSQEEEMQEEGQTLTVINPESSLSNSSNPPSTEEGKEYQIQTRLTDFRLLSASKGLAWGSTRSELRLYVTQDNGKTWINISPAASVQFPNNPQYGKDLYFVDTDHGWIVRDSLGSGEAIVLRTGDGGATWKMTSLPEADDVASIYFLDQSLGWILTKGQGPDSSEAKALYKTTNSGATWEKIMSTPILPTDTSVVDQTLPKLGDPVGMVFTDDKNGYITMVEAGLPALYVTKSGGRHWVKSNRFFEQDKFTTCERFTVGEPSFFNSGNTGWISFGCGRENALKYNGYFTASAGKSWTLAPFGLPWQAGSHGNMTTTFINTKEGWSLQGSGLYHTLDQGNSWTLLPESKKLNEVLDDYPVVVKIQFYSSKTGWLLVEKSDKKRSLLMQTQDGGISWRVL
ncbi:photosynthesis system II assembly factor YCF48-like protein [Fontibacillus phaseoli]|uniref:Photosynthesis system II assembly factor YCF48-like protein n=1 Tax=Fontibacillus phaseoli TaxID=1416533 RepID=A0A369BPQ0_9BACL|nr:YCF48-related protein [Fontibacillus phaseoli]RCX23602.1 photosynthesis system II assembly factor YCF48-like protein [Fontibacillus phaseoli]